MQQLELFAQPTPTPQYKTGDWVKTKRKPAIAAHVKRGEIFQVSAVHPISGCMKFHNPHINDWDFLYPDEVKSCPRPVTVESVVEIVSGAATKTNVESVVEIVTGVTTEASVESVVEIVTSAVTEVSVESVVEIVTGAATEANGWLDYHYKVRISGQQHSIRKPQDKCTGPYYTYRWKEEGKQRAKYVPHKKMGEVYIAIGMKRPPSEIIKIIESPNKLDSIIKK